MQTHITDDPSEAAAFIRQGEIVAFPTETVYGLGADVFSPGAVAKIFAAKGRPSDNPLIAHVAEEDQIGSLASDVPAAAQAFIRRFFPGPLTLVLPRRETVPDVATAGLPTIGIRMPRHPAAAAFLASAGTPVAAPSANLSGRPSPTTWEAVASDLAGRIACILKGPQAETGIESTVVDCTGGVPVVLRPGAVTLEQLRAVVPTTVLGATDPGLLARSPGTRHRHYAPSARVRLVDSPSELPARGRFGYIGLEAPRTGSGADPVLTCRDAEAYAYELFAFFRLCDRLGVEEIYCQRVGSVGIGRALMDRLTRAATG